MNHEGVVLIYDGYCNLCGAIVRFVKRHDRQGRFVYVPLQSERGGLLLNRAGLKHSDTGSVVLSYKGKYLRRSDAALMVFRLIGGGWMILYGLIIIPGFIRNFVYDIIAKARYRLFGRSASCYIP
jgi:predicted DCC family thiol-disulfide oxidoreductase YuxK